MTFSYRETQIVKGMLERGDKQHDIASYFGVNGGRVAEVSTGKCDYPSAPAAPTDKLPPPGPYVGAKTVFEVRGILDEAIELLEGAGSNSSETQVALDALREAHRKLA
ncbi:hypothetical protein [Thioclava electrotropha]|uniref:Transposase IS30-like HTH domain-containing protein n=1 Tax=Thioclava electrotropha TaxID=1549850 RepID=A0ABX6YXW3_9RHOB|nr:hypothetical protein [Thioclava electrotropha]QPZ92114.1 hypothetical protein AKL02_015300 [Thioclava electrotropha]